MILNLIFLCAASTCWSALAAISAFVAAIIAGFYTYYTYQLLTKTKESLDLSTDALKLSRRTIELNETSLEGNKKLTEYQIYKEFGEKLYKKDVYKLMSDIKTYKEKHFYDNELEFVRYEVLNHLEDLAKFYEDNLITIESVNSGFGTMILYLGSNKGVIQIIKDEREIFPTIFSGFEYLYEQIYNKCNETERIGFLPKLF